jgi:hypothetical protein
MEIETVKKLSLWAQEETQKRFPALGVNKKREISRLLFEVAKSRGQAPSADILPEKIKNFDQEKNTCCKKDTRALLQTCAQRTSICPNLI